jgi:hypothetical protein
MKSGKQSNDVGAMNNLHLIDGAIFDTTYAEQTVPEDQRSQLDDFIKNNLMNVIDEVFEQVDNDIGNRGSVLRLDNLEIDLGEIVYRDYRQQMPAKLRAELLQAFGEIRYSASGSLSSTKLVDSKSAAQSQLFYFLRNGYLPWYARVADTDVLDSLLIESVDSSPEFLLEFIRANAERAGVLARLLHQFSPQSLQRVMRLLSASRDSAAGQALVRLESMLQTDGNVEYSGLESLPTQTPARVAGTDQAAPIDRLHTQLVAALLSGDAGQIESVWQLLYTDQAELLEKTIRYYGQLAAVRRHIVASFSVEQRADLLRLLEPDAHGFVHALMDHVQIFQPEADDPASYQAPQLTGLWETSLGYLLVERGIEFDQRSYILSLLRQAAASSQLSSSVLLARLRQNIGSLSESGKPDEWSRQLIALIELIDPAELTDPFGPGEPAHSVDANEPTEPIELAESPELTEQDELSTSQRGAESTLAVSYRRYEHIKSALTIVDMDRQILETKLVADIKQLRLDAPWLLLRFFRELQTGGYAWSQIIPDLAQPVLTEFVYALLSLNHQADGTRPFGSATELAAAIHARADSSADRHAFFSYILSRLINGELIDLEAKESQQPAADLPSDQHDVALDSGDKPVQTATGNLDVEPDLSAMSQRAREQMLLCAELLTSAAYATETALSVERLQTVKWQFIQAYVTGTGYLFNESYFVPQYIDYLIQQARVSDHGQFRAMLGQALLQNSLSVTQAMTQRLIEALNEGAYDIPRSVARAVDDVIATDDEPLPLEDIYIANAGMVLLAPYLPRLFERLGFTDAGEFIDRDAAERAVHCLQFLVNTSITSPEYQLVLNKLLCGVKPGHPIRRGIELTADEREQLEGLLHAVTQHWKALENTSIDGLRESFLQRNGRLQGDNEAWRLAVESRPFDMLLDQIPWSFTTIKFPWMERVIYVEWR